ncbi:hypothetical protein EVAR_68427_1 [Eumeta japonica]|uniref:Uncharacterized protein n=1 Tax=Eumeta variegata TaxID=151549 RepID=A0A4C1ZVE6_EUMVA|nr:hypothetical protein EVAR_68427_1 [Eumeta japonica]
MFEDTSSSGSFKSVVKFHENKKDDDEDSCLFGVSSRVTPCVSAVKPPQLHCETLAARIARRASPRRTAPHLLALIRRTQVAQAATRACAFAHASDSPPRCFIVMRNPPLI